MGGREARNHLREHQEEQRLGEIANPLLLQGSQKIPSLPRLVRFCQERLYFLADLYFAIMASPGSRSWWSVEGPG